MKFFILDDDVDFLNYVKDKITFFYKNKNIDIELVCHTCIPQKFFNDIDAYFLDIEIYNNTTFDYVNQIKSRNQFVPIIFFSNYDYYVNQSVKYFIFDFIRKRHFNDEIEDTLERLTSYLDINQKKIIIKNNKTVTCIKLDEILYIEAYSHNCIIHTTNNIYNFNKGIKEILNKNISKLSKIHRSYYINITHISFFSSNEVILNKNILLPVGKKYKNNLKNEIMKIL